MSIPLTPKQRQKRRTDHWLVDTLRQQIPGQNYKDLYEPHSRQAATASFGSKTPNLIEAEIPRTVFR